MGKLQIYKASAGSGKTHLLTEFYIKLAFEHPDNFKHILAVTFTNKAADEMKGRILLKISDIIEKKNRAEHFSAIKEHLGSTDEQLIECAKSVRKNILHNYSNFKVGTIDSFIQRIIRAFSFELNLNSAYDIEFDTDKVIKDLTELLLNKIPDDHELKDWLVKLIEDKIDEGIGWDIRKEIYELTKELFKEEYQKLNISAKTKQENSSNKNLILSELKRIRSDFERKISKLSDDYLSIISKYEIDFEGLGRNFKTIYNFFAKAIPAKKYEVETDGLKNSVNGIENWYAKSAKKEIIQIIEGVYPELSILIHTFFDLLKEEGEQYYSVLSILKQFYAFGIIDDTAVLLPEYRNDNNLLLISDITLLLKEIIGKNDAPFIYEKAGNQYKHILIDEFQDTSRYQWSIFKPLFLNSLSQSFSNLIVGDVKQSVYRWRNGDWKLLLKGVKNEIGYDLIEEYTLDTNWRSKKNIVKFNNTIFQIIPKILQQQFNRKSSEVFQYVDTEDRNELFKSQIIIDAYSSSIQSVPDKPEKEGGKVIVKFIDKGLNSNDYNESLSQCLPQTIDRLLKSGRYRPEDIGILVRKNDDAEKTVKIIGNYQEQVPDALNYALISPKSLKISESRAVKILISAMKYINEPSDQLNLAELLYYCNIHKGPVDVNIIFLSIVGADFTVHLPESFEAKELSVYETLFDLCENLIQVFDLYRNKDDFPYIRAFRELLSDHTFGRNLSLSEFIEFWDEKGCNTTIELPETTDAVKIMTIHRSKGLAFKVVFIPYTDWAIDNGNKGPLLWVSSRIPGLDSSATFPVKYTSLLKKTFYKNEYLDEQLMAYTDAINMLYVAFTRAKDELYIYSPEFDSKNKTDIVKIGQALHQAILTNIEISDDDADLTVRLCDYYDSDIKEFCFDLNHDLNKIPGVEPFVEAETIHVDLNAGSYTTFDWYNRLNIKFHASDFFIESSKEIQEKVSHGILMHRIFSEIKTETDIDKALQNLIFEGLITQKESTDLRETILKVLSRPIVKEWFSERYEVKTEEALLTYSGEIRIPDRVLINEEKIIVIDFKFGIKHEKYAAQINEYKQLLEQAYDRKSEAYIYYVEEDLIETI